MTWDELLYLLKMIAPANLNHCALEAHADSMFKNPVGGVHSERTPEQLTRCSAAQPLVHWMADWCNGIISAIQAAVDATCGEVAHGSNSTVAISVNGACRWECVLE